MQFNLHRWLNVKVITPRHAFLSKRLIHINLFCWKKNYYRKSKDAGGTTPSSLLKSLFWPPETSRNIVILSNDEPPDVFLGQLVANIFFMHVV